MYLIADEIGLPISFVELRHQVAHETLPTLALLRHAVPRALAWLWDHFWQRIDEGQPTKLSHDDQNVVVRNSVARLREAFKDIFRPYIRWKIKMAKEFLGGNGQGADVIKEESKMIEQACQRCVRICKGHPQTIAILVSALADTRFLIPANRTYVSSSTPPRSYLQAN